MVIEQSLGRPQAFAAIFDRHFDAVHDYARRRLGKSLAEEITSETFIRAFDRRASFDRARVDARPWLFGIAANLMRRHWRTERRRLAALERLRPRTGRRDADRGTRRPHRSAGCIAGERA